MQTKPTIFLFPSLNPVPSIPCFVRFSLPLATHHMAQTRKTVLHMSFPLPGQNSQMLSILSVDILRNPFAFLHHHACNLCKPPPVLDKTIVTVDYFPSNMAEELTMAA